MLTFYQKLVEVLRKDDRFFSEGAEGENELLRNAIYEAAMKMDQKLISLLYENEELRSKFFVMVEGGFVFDKVEFGWIINNRQLFPDSYTRYKNKIGLANSNEQLLSSKEDIVLLFPYKDCILEGGQTKEDQKKNEVFYNKSLAPDEVDCLLSPKTFVKVRKHTIQGETTTSIIEDSDNLIIKGNNLLGLSSILKRFENKVKCIYIDPPFNIGGDGFNYNDNFKHSTWLTFFKNRAELAKRLLREDGSMFVHIDYHELGYVIPIMDEIFGKNNCVQIISVRSSSPAGFKTVNPGPVDVTEYVLFYTKNRNCFKFKKMFVPTGYDSNYNLYIENPTHDPLEWKLVPLSNVIYELNGIKVGKTIHESNKNAKLKWGEHWKTIRTSCMEDFALKNSQRVVSIRDPQKPTAELKGILDISRIKKDKIMVYRSSSEGEPTYVINGGALSFYSNKVKELEGKLTPTELLTDLWTDISWDGIANEGSVKLKNGKKPERLLKRIIEMSTEKGDLVLDYHLGSGTTCAVAHKIGRQYIGIEQLNYEENDSIVRLKKVIDGDPTGISKLVGWKGKGSFISCELGKCNQLIVDKVCAAESDLELCKIFEIVSRLSTLNSKIDLKKLQDNANEYSSLEISNKKRLILDLLDLNMLYINYSDIDDELYEVSEEIKKFNNNFYGA